MEKNIDIAEVIIKQTRFTEDHAKKAFRKKFNADLDILLNAIPQDFRCEVYDYGMLKKYLWCDEVFITEHSRFEYVKDKLIFTSEYEY